MGDGQRLIAAGPPRASPQRIKEEVINIMRHVVTGPQFLLLSLALVGAHPRSDQGVGGLQSDARSHSPPSITCTYRYAADSTDNFMTHRY